MRTPVRAMRRWKWVLLLGVMACLLSASRPASAGFYGNEFLSQSEDARLHYVIGVVEGWHNTIKTIVTSKWQAPDVDRIYGGIVRCVTTRRMTYGQIHAIVEKYMKDHP